MIGDADSRELIETLAVELREKNIVQAPEWAHIVKTGTSKQKPPVRGDWWFVRAAAVLRAIWKLGPIGVSKLRVKYGGKKNNGYTPAHFRKGSGKIIRLILQQYEKEGLVKQVSVNGRKGRALTQKGKELLTSMAKKSFENPKTDR
ncbi:MAG: 30S ribosomal protein S19e [Candidatus Woesearchaeota archaeon]